MADKLSYHDDTILKNIRQGVEIALLHFESIKDVHHKIYFATELASMLMTHSGSIQWLAKTTADNMGQENV